ncbi:MAG: toll/interleukin-1 receptor domain-containing protein [Pseudomonadota bacterium]
MRTEHATRRIELYQGDLTQIPQDMDVDLLVVSAFPDDYLTTSTSVVGALSRAGLSVAELAANKQLDLRSSRSCWLSRPVPSGFGFDQLLCFEPLLNGPPEEVVDDVFDFLNLLLLDSHRDAIVAMPVVASGDMGRPSAEMLTAIVEASMQWLRVGLPLGALKIVELDDDRARRLQIVFDALGRASPESVPAMPGRRARPPAPSRWSRGDVQGALDQDGSLIGGIMNRGPSPPSPVPPTVRPPSVPPMPPEDPWAWDCFISYSHEDNEAVDTFINALRSRSPNLRIFRDSQSLRTGSAWIEKLAEAIDECHRFVAVYSPRYFDSRWCQKELQSAIVRDMAAEDELLYPILIVPVPDMHSMYQTFNHRDCTVVDHDKLEFAADELVALLSG